MACFSRPDQVNQLLVPQGQILQNGNGAHEKAVDELLFDLGNLPTPDLTPEEEFLPSAEKELRIMVKKCVALGAFGILDLPNVLSLIQPDLDGYEEEGEVLFQHGDGPELFHLMWFKNSDKGYLLNRWLTDNIKSFDRVTGLEASIGRMVAAYYAGDGYWYRAVVLDDYDEKHVRVVFIDYGNGDIVPLPYMRELPKELTRIPPLSFAATLVDLNPFDAAASSKLDRNIRRKFIYMVNEGGALKARLKHYNKDKHVWEVFLWRGPEPFVEINEMVRELIFKKHNTPLMKPCEVSKLDLNKLIHLTHEVSIREYREVSFKGLRNYRVTHVDNPTNFSVEMISMEEASDKFLPEAPWQEFMQCFYNDPANAHKYRLRTSRVFVNRCYVWKNPEKNIWRRVRVMRVWLEVRRCEIYAVDVGYFRSINFDDIYEICVQFSTPSALSCNAFLVDICPPGDCSAWPEGSTKGFSDLVKRKIFQGVVISRETVDHGFADSTSTTVRLGLVLIEKRNQTSHTLNSQLCKLGLADCDGLAGRPDLSSEMTSSAHFDAEEFQEYLTENGQDPDSMIPINLAVPSVLTGVFPGESTNEGVMWTRRPGSYGARLSGVDRVCEDMERLPTAIRTRLGICHILRVTSPGCFYVQLTESVPELTQMMGNIRAQVEDMAPLQLSEIVDGSFIAVNMIDDHDESNWHRAIVKQHLTKIKMIKVILIDYGAEARTRKEYVRKLPEFFKTIPSFCHRVHLNAKGVTPHNGLKWTQLAKDVFRRYVNTWERQEPVYYVWYPKKSSKLQLEEFDQDVQFNPETEEWELGDKHSVPSEKYVTDMKDHVMLKNLFCSLGVDVAYEIFTSANEEYKFANIWDILKEKGFADHFEERPDDFLDTKVFSDCEFEVDDEDAGRWESHPEAN